MNDPTDSQVATSIQDIQEQLEHIIRKIFSSIPEELKIRKDTKLFNGGISLNSTQIIELTLALETHFNIELEPEMLIPENFVDLNALSTIVYENFFI
jgi:acyl carrier protein